MEFKYEVFDRFNGIFKKKRGSKQKKAELLREQEDLIQELEMQKDVIQQLKKALDKAHDDIEIERQKHYLEGVRRGKFIANLEVIGALEEYRMLQEITSTLEKPAKEDCQNFIALDNN